MKEQQDLDQQIDQVLNSISNVDLDMAKKANNGLDKFAQDELLKQELQQEVDKVYGSGRNGEKQEHSQEKHEREEKSEQN